MADERRTETVEASPAEARFLRRFVRRTTLPWIACVGALAGLALGVALAPPPPAPLIGAAPSDTRVSAAIEKLRSELANLREEVEALRSAEPAQSTLPDEFQARVAKLEAELAARPALAPQMADAVPDSGDLATIRDRLYNLESRLDSKEQERAALQKDLLARIFELERSVQTEAAARVDNLETGEQRVERLERRLSTLESLPAAPAPSADPR